MQRTTKRLLIAACLAVAIGLGIWAYLRWKKPATTTETPATKPTIYPPATIPIAGEITTPTGNGGDNGGGDNGGGGSDDGGTPVTGNTYINNATGTYELVVGNVINPQYITLELIEGLTGGRFRVRNVGSMTPQPGMAVQLTINKAWAEVNTLDQRVFTAGQPYTIDIWEFDPNKLVWQRRGWNQRVGQIVFNVRFTPSSQA